MTLDTRVRGVYLTDTLFNESRKYDAHRPAQHHVPSPRRPHPPRDPHAALRGRGHRDRAGRAVLREPARDLAAPEGARARGADRPRPLGAVPAEHPAGRAARAGGGVDGAVPRAVGGPDGPARSASRQPQEGIQPWLTPPRRPTTRSTSSEATTHRPRRSGR